MVRKRVVSRNTLATDVCVCVSVRVAGMVTVNTDPLPTSVGRVIVLTLTAVAVETW